MYTSNSLECGILFFLYFSTKIPIQDRTLTWEPPIVFTIINYPKFYLFNTSDSNVFLQSSLVTFLERGENKRTFQQIAFGDFWILYLLWRTVTLQLALWMLCNAWRPSVALLLVKKQTNNNSLSWKRLHIVLSQGKVAVSFVFGTMIS